MLQILVIIVSLKLTVANDFFENCPVIASSKNDIDIMNYFQKVVTFVEASTDSKQDRNYDIIDAQMRSVVSSQKLKRELGQIAKLLMEKKYEEVIKKCDTHEAKVGSINQPNAKEVFVARSYLDFFSAEAYRLIGNGRKASDFIAEVTFGRQLSMGVSINDLEKLNALIVLQKVSKFNHEVDKFYGLEDGPRIDLIASLHSKSGGTLDPVKINQHYKRINPEQDNFDAKSLDKRCVQEILCEFIQKLVILESSTSADYQSILSEIKEFDANSARKFYNEVIMNFNNGEAEEALKVLTRSFQTGGSSSSRTSLQQSSIPVVMESYAIYMAAEIKRRSGENCSFMNYIETLVEKLKTIRQTNKGVSLGKMLKLAGEVTLLLVDCFNKRIRSIYELTGNESEQELGAKRVKYADCKQVLPLIQFSE